MIAPGSTVHTDGLASYCGLEALGYQHEVSVLLGRKKDAAVRLLPRVHQVASLLFRFNRRKSHSRGKLFYRFLQQAVQVGPATYHKLVGGKDANVENHNM